jgi:DNA repair exonuclease SbcCD ATPase subunit
LASNLNRRIASLEQQLVEQQELLADESRHKLVNQSSVRKLELEVQALLEEQQENEGEKQKLVNEIAKLNLQLADARKKANEDIIQQYEDLKKRSQKELENAQQLIDTAEAAQKRAEASKKKFQQEVSPYHFTLVTFKFKIVISQVEDQMVEINSLRTNQKELDKKQKRFDQLLNEEKVQLQKVVMERDSFAQDSRDRETKILSLNNELVDLKAKNQDLENYKRMLQIELDESVLFYIFNKFYNLTLINVFIFS